MKNLSYLLVVVVTALYACSPASQDAPQDVGPWSTGVVLPSEPGQTGDAERGRYLLLHGSYMSCGVPYRLWENDLSANVVKSALGVTEGSPTLPGREGRNADLPYMLNAFTTSDGVDVMNANCLHCHAGEFNGELVVGLAMRPWISRGA